MFKTNKINEDIILTQISDGLLFGTDALQLAYFVCENAKRSTVAVELGTGSSVASLIIAKRIPEKIERIYAIEIQDDYVKLAYDNVVQNNLTNKISVVQGDIRDGLFIMSEHLSDTTDIVFTNPPYMNTHGVQSENDYKNIAKHEILCDIDDVMRTTKRLLKSKGEFFCVYPAERLQYLFNAMGKYDINPKVIRFIHARQNAKANLVLVKGKKNSGIGLEVLPPVIL